MDLWRDRRGRTWRILNAAFEIVRRSWKLKEPLLHLVKNEFRVHKKTGDLRFICVPDEPMDNVTVEKMDSEAGNRAQWMVVR